MIALEIEHTTQTNQTVRSVSDLKELYKFQSQSEIERYSTFRSYAQSMLGLAGYSPEELRNKVKEIEVKYKRSSAAYFGSLIRKGFINYGDLQPDGTVDLEMVKARYNYLPESTFAKEFEFLKVYKVSERTVKKAQTISKNSEDINVVIMMDALRHTEPVTSENKKAVSAQASTIEKNESLISRLNTDKNQLTTRLEIDDHGRLTKHYFNVNGVDISMDNIVREVNANGKIMTFILPKTENIPSKNNTPRQRFNIWSRPAFKTS